jgi:hypothetical protein
MRFFPASAKARPQIMKAAYDRLEIELVSRLVLYRVNDDAYIETAISAEVLILDDLV